MYPAIPNNALTYQFEAQIHLTIKISGLVKLILSLQFKLHANYLEYSLENIHIAAP